MTCYSFITSHCHNRVEMHNYRIYTFDKHSNLLLLFAQKYDVYTDNARSCINKPPPQVITYRVSVSQYYHITSLSHILISSCTLAQRVSEGKAVQCENEKKMGLSPHQFMFGTYTYSHSSLFQFSSLM